MSTVFAAVPGLALFHDILPVNCFFVCVCHTSLCYSPTVFCFIEQAQMQRDLVSLVEDLLQQGSRGRLSHTPHQGLGSMALSHATSRTWVYDRLSHTPHQGLGSMRQLSHTNIKDWVHETALSHKHQGLGSMRQLSHTNIKDWVHETALSHKHQGLGP